MTWLPTTLSSLFSVGWYSGGGVPLRDLELLLLVEALRHLFSKIYIRCVAWPCSACETQRKAGEGRAEAPRLFHYLSRPFAVLASPRKHILSDIDIVVVASCSLNQAHYPNLHTSGHVLWGRYNWPSRQTVHGWDGSELLERKAVTGWMELELVQEHSFGDCWAWTEKIAVPIAWFVYQPFPLERPGEPYGDVGRRELERKTESSALQSWKSVGQDCCSAHVIKKEHCVQERGIPSQLSTSHATCSDFCISWPAESPERLELFKDSGSLAREHWEEVISIRNGQCLADATTSRKLWWEIRDLSARGCR